MLNTISAEFMKYKRSIIWILFFTALTVYILMILLALPTKDQVAIADFRYLFFDSFPFIFLLHIIVMSLLGSVMFSLEYSGNTLRQLVTLPLSVFRFFLAKYVMICVISMLLMLGTSIGLTVISLLTHASELTPLNFLWISGILALDGLTISAALSPILFIMVISRQNFVLPLFASFLYGMTVMLPSLGIIKIKDELFSYITPIGNMGMLHNELVYRGFSSDIPTLPSPAANWVLCAIFLLLYTILFTILSIFALKRQNH